MDMIYADVRAKVTSIQHYSCAVFERGEHSLAEFLKNNRRLHQTQKVYIFHQLLQGVFFLHNEKGASDSSLLFLSTHVCLAVFVTT
jgi:hypothetical protein